MPFRAWEQYPSSLRSSSSWVDRLLQHLCMRLHCRWQQNVCYLLQNNNLVACLYSPEVSKTILFEYLSAWDFLGSLPQIVHWNNKPSRWKVRQTVDSCDTILRQIWISIYLPVVVLCFWITYECLISYPSLSDNMPQLFKISILNVHCLNFRMMLAPHSA